MAFMIVHNPIQAMFDYAPNLTCTLFEAEPYPVLYSYVLLAIVILKGMAATMPNHYLAMNHMKIWKITFALILTSWTIEYIIILLRYKTLCTKHNIYNHQEFDNFTLDPDIMFKKPATLNSHIALVLMAWLLKFVWNLFNQIIKGCRRFNNLRVTHVHTISRYMNNINSFQSRVCVMNDCESEIYQPVCETVNRSIVNHQESKRDLLLDCNKLDTGNISVREIQDNKEKTSIIVPSSRKFASRVHCMPIRLGEPEKGITEVTLEYNVESPPVQEQEMTHIKPHEHNQLQQDDDLEVEEEIHLSNNVAPYCSLDNSPFHDSQLDQSDYNNTPPSQNLGSFCCPSKLSYPNKSALNQPKPVLIPRGVYQEILRVPTPVPCEIRSQDISPKLR